MSLAKLPASVFWTAVIVALVVSFGVDFLNTAHGGAIDLRNRVTGIRLMAHGVDPYTFKWHTGDPDTALDVYNNPQLPVSKTTATPTLLLVLATWQALPYRLTEFLWLLAQWFLLTGAGLSAIWAAAREMRRPLAFFFTVFTYTAAWRLHAERGQSYIVLVLFFTVWLIITSGSRLRGVAADWLGGFLAGVLMALRPTFLLLLPFLAWHRRGQTAGAALGLILAVTAPMLVRPTCWNEYFAAMQVNSELYRNGVDYPPGPQHYPSAIESTPTDLVAAFSVIPYADFSCFALLRALGMDHAWLGHDAVPAWPAIALFGLVFAGWCWATCGVVATRLLPGLAGWIFLADLVLPAYRDTYNDVLILPVVAAALLEPGEIPKAVMLCAAALPIGVVVYALVPEQVIWINLPTALFTIGAVWSILASAVPPRSA